MLDFTTLWHDHAQAVHRYALFLAGNSADAEDLTSETFVRAWMASDRLRVATVRAYLCAIARNLYLDGWRRRRPHQPIDEAVEARVPSPEAAAAGRLELERTLAALQEVPEGERSALLLRAEEGLTHEEIAVVLGVSVVAVKVRIHRARVRLARILRAEGKGP